MAMGDSPFIVKLESTYQNKYELIFVMHLYDEGNLKSLVENSKNKNKGLRTSHATFYAAEIICGLEYLHNQGITHRDLKPENILLKEGHISIGDFGISKCKIEEGTENSGGGTKAYISPEMYKSKEYDNRVDWWSLGIIIYFMLKGETPFGTEDEDRIRAITGDSSHVFNFDSNTFKNRNSSSIINSLLK